MAIINNLPVSTGSDGEGEDRNERKITYRDEASDSNLEIWESIEYGPERAVPGEYTVLYVNGQLFENRGGTVYDVRLESNTENLTLQRISASGDHREYYFFKMPNQDVSIRITY